MRVGAGVAGSSPLARGLLYYTAWPWVVDTDHPRSRGVYPTGQDDTLTSMRIIPARAGFTRHHKSRPPHARDHPRSRGVYARRLLGNSARRRIIPARAGFTMTRRDRLPVGKDHPRSRGVYSTKTLEGAWGNGSSPLARGLLPRLGVLLRSRLDHPRSRGVYRHLLFSGISRYGSSPLARGLRGGSYPQGFPQGIIPARAGFTESLFVSLDDAADHPRSRGVYTVTDLVTIINLGSSPLARGLLPGLFQHLYPLGIIPARAGFTRMCSSTSIRSSDHPRSRGVYKADLLQKWRETGSSPLARGLPHQHTTESRESQDHPRSRGVYEFAPDTVVCEQGSSPLARGLRGAGHKETSHGRIIPARAGFTEDARDPESVGRDHPRSRGVYTSMRSSTGSWRGSSPLARGLLFSRLATAIYGKDHPRSRGVYTWRSA